MKKQFLVEVSHTKGSNVIWTWVEDNITKENKENK